MSFDLNAGGPYCKSKNHILGAIGSLNRMSYLGKQQRAVGQLRYMFRMCNYIIRNSATNGQCDYDPLNSREVGLY